LQGRTAFASTQVNKRNLNVDYLKAAIQIKQFGQNTKFFRRVNKGSMDGTKNNLY
jgi:hypothetical protein